MADSVYRSFVQSVIDNIKKNGFPNKKVAFPIEQLYEAAYGKGINLNRVLETLDEVQIAHTKTEEKIIFYPKDRAAPPGKATGMSDPFLGLDPDMVSKLDLSKLAGLAADMAKNMTPEQRDALKDFCDNMSKEDLAILIEKAGKLGLL